VIAFTSDWDKYARIAYERSESSATTSWEKATRVDFAWDEDGGLPHIPFHLVCSISFPSNQVVCLFQSVVGHDQSLWMKPISDSLQK
jgi:hypothetical protein